MADEASPDPVALIEDLLRGSEERIERLEERLRRERAKVHLRDQIMRESCRQQGLLDARAVIENGYTRGIR